MCELFGLCAQNEYDIREYLREFFAHSVRHPHGWGLACQDGGNHMYVEREPRQASESQKLADILARPVTTHTALAHIRYATIGHVEDRNCHPYVMRDCTGRTWTLIHNGTIFDYAPLNRYVYLQTGDTDSERILLYLVDQINDREALLRRPLNRNERFRLLESVLVPMAKGNKLNLIFTDGEVMYAHTNYRDSLYYLQEQGRIWFATVPLDQKEWRPVPFMRLMAYVDGQILFEGKQHWSEYIYNAENMKYLYQTFAGL
ncbi:MAG: class II glutamine amidotransferase [Lachnospiraceae bacterium]|nr:class II glutamine amidotransferase [Lachnospiraceae bacterium]